MAETHEERLAGLGIQLPPPHTPGGNYVPGVITGNLLFISGQGPRLSDGSFASGTVGVDVGTDEAYEHARLCGFQVLSAARHTLGNLNRVRRVVKVLGMVRASAEFGEQPQVVNGFSDLMVEVFGEAGRHARSAVGMGSLPRGITVEVEAIFEVV